MMMSFVLSEFSLLNTLSENLFFIMDKKPCLKSAKYSQIQIVSVFVSVCHYGIRTHLVFEDPCSRDPHTWLELSIAKYNLSQECLDLLWVYFIILKCLNYTQLLYNIILMCITFVHVAYV